MHLRTRKRWFFILCFAFLSACSSETYYAPVTDISLSDSIPKSGYHRVKRGETLYEIAWRYGLDYRDLAQQNALVPPYAIYPDERIYLRKNAPSVPTKKRKEIVEAPSIEPPSRETKPSSSSARFANKEPNFVMKRWYWPAKGRLIRSFSTKYKGINIAARLGSPVYAAGPGKVVYAGDGLRGYGNLIILKHNSLYLSAYAHNRQILVKEGEWVKQGQQIAEMGSTGTNRTMLHFEIRRGGQSINPMKLLRS